MSTLLTLVSSTKTAPLMPQHFEQIAREALAFTGDIVWLAPDHAAEITLSHNDVPPDLIQNLRDILEKDRIDFFITDSKNRRKKLLLADMDSTIVSSETLDDLAKHAGIEREVAAITARAMEGELDFHEALKHRVSLLKGLCTTALSTTLEETTLNPGAEIFVRTMHENGATCVLVSGGFSIFTETISKRCGFNFNHGNQLDIEDGMLTGRVIPPILDKQAKVNFLQHYIKELGLIEEDCLAIGDGANDLPMLKMAGLGIGYHPKKTIREAISNCILYGDLTAALYAQGYGYKDF